MEQDNKNNSKSRAENNFVSIQNLMKVYPNGAKAVYNFDLDIKRNEFIVIVGPSGCGKTTTLRMIAGLEDISDGEVYIDNELVNYKPSKDRKIAIVFQSYALYPQMSVFDNIAFPLKINKYPLPVVNDILLTNREIIELFNITDVEFILSVLKESNNKKLTHLEPYEHVANRLNICTKTSSYLLSLKLLKEDKSFEVLKEEVLQNAQNNIEKEMKKLNTENKFVNEKSQYIDADGNVILENQKMTKDEIKNKIFETAKILDLGPLLDRLPKQLSGGQMQRVALGRAIVKNVPLFLMDEPLSNLDAKLRLTMRTEIVKLHNKINATTIYVTHDQTEAMTMATKIIVMSKGFVQQIGSPKEIYDDPKNLFVAKFIGAPSINIFNGTVSNNEVKIGKNILIKPKDDFQEFLKNFYEKKLEKFQSYYDHFDYAAQEEILKIQSALADEKSIIRYNPVKNNFVKKIKDLFNKTQNIEIEDKEHIDCLEIINNIKEALNGNVNLIFALRPERINIKKSNENNVNAFKPIVSELLGSDYHIHFNYGDNQLVAIEDSKNPISIDDFAEFNFDASDLLIFDPITGDRIDYQFDEGMAL